MRAPLPATNNIYCVAEYSDPHHVVQYGFGSKPSCVTLHVQNIVLLGSRIVISTPLTSLG